MTSGGISNFCGVLQICITHLEGRLTDPITTSKEP
jgi:hypothetical protein